MAVNSAFGATVNVGGADGVLGGAAQAARVISKRPTLWQRAVVLASFQLPLHRTLVSRNDWITKYTKETRKTRKSTFVHFAHFALLAPFAIQIAYCLLGVV